MLWQQQVIKLLKADNGYIHRAPITVSMATGDTKYLPAFNTQLYFNITISLLSHCCHLHTGVIMYCPRMCYLWQLFVNQIRAGTTLAGKKRAPKWTVQQTTLVEVNGDCGRKWGRGSITHSTFQVHAGSKDVVCPKSAATDTSNPTTTLNCKVTLGYFIVENSCNLWIKSKRVTSAFKYVFKWTSCGHLLVVNIQW